MKSPRLPAAAASVLLFALPACAQDEAAHDHGGGEQTEAAAHMEGVTQARAQIIDRARNIAGTAHLRQGPGGVVMRIELDNLPEDQRGAWHGGHFHMIGDCSNEDFTSSGGHINPDGRAHGLLNRDGPDNGDMPNIWFHEDGSARAEIYTPYVSIAGQTDAPALLDRDGSALVIHANPDDHESQPIGGAGPRILCGVIEPAQ